MDAEPYESEATAPEEHAGRHVLRAAEHWLSKTGLRVLAYVLAAFLVIKLIPSLKGALKDLERLSWPWLLAVFALETVSELGFVTSWHAIVDPDSTLARRGGAHRFDARLAWAQLGAGMFVPGGSLSSVGAGTWLLHRLGMPVKQVVERQFNLSFLNTTVDALALVVFGLGLGIGLLSGATDPLLTLLPAAVAALGIAVALAAASHRRRHAAERKPKHAKTATAITTVATAVDDTAALLVHRSGMRSVLGALVYLFFDVAVLYTAFIAINAHPVPTFGVVLMAYIIGALGGSIPLPASIGSVGGMVGMLIVYGVKRDAAVAAVVLYQAVGLLVPFIGGGLAYLLLRREFRQSPAAVKAA